MNAMKISSYVYEVDLEQDWFGIYTPFEHGLCFISKKTWGDVRRGAFDMVADSTISLLRSKKIIVNVCRYKNIISTKNINF